MPKPQESKPKYTVYVRLLSVVEVEVEADTVEEALAIGRTWERSDILTYTDDVSENDYSLRVFGALNPADWSTD